MVHTVGALIHMASHVTRLLAELTVGARFRRRQSTPCPAAARIRRRQSTPCPVAARIRRRQSTPCLAEARIRRRQSTPCPAEARFRRRQSTPCLAEARIRQWRTSNFNNLPQLYIFQSAEQCRKNNRGKKKLSLARERG